MNFTVMEQLFNTRERMDISNYTVVFLKKNALLSTFMQRLKQAIGIITV